GPHHQPLGLCQHQKPGANHGRAARKTAPALLGGHQPPARPLWQAHLHTPPPPLLHLSRRSHLRPSRRHQPPLAGRLSITNTHHQHAQKETAMIITDLEIRCCRHSVEALDASSMRSADHRQELEFLVITLKTDSGLQASTFGFAGRSARGSGELAAAAMRPFLIGRNALDREAIWQQFRTEDRWWNHLPIYSFGPFDIALWLLGAQAAGQPLYQYIGGCRDQVPVY